MRDLLSMHDLEKKDVELLLSEAAKMEDILKRGGSDLLKGKIIANLFFEPSTRTNISFQVAARRLGAGTVIFNSETSSAAKGESLADTIRIMDGYADALVIRHPQEGTAHLAAGLAAHPVINAGDGANEHPTQALIDLYTIKKLKGKIEGLNVTLFGDLAHARAMHSLLWGLAMCGAKITLVSPASLSMDEKAISEAREKFGAAIAILPALSLENTDILYMCRLQKERLGQAKGTKGAGANFGLTSALLSRAKPGMAMLHPLPKTSEVPPDMDADPRAKYFEQAKNGIPVRMAILKHCLM